MLGRCWGGEREVRGRCAGGARLVVGAEVPERALDLAVLRAERPEAGLEAAHCVRAARRAARARARRPHELVRWEHARPPSQLRLHHGSGPRRRERQQRRRARSAPAEHLVVLAATRRRAVRPHAARTPRRAHAARPAAVDPHEGRILLALARGSPRRAVCRLLLVGRAVERVVGAAFLEELALALLGGRAHHEAAVVGAGVARLELPGLEGRVHAPRSGARGETDAAAFTWLGREAAAVVQEREADERAACDGSCHFTDKTKDPRILTRSGSGSINMGT